MKLCAKRLISVLMFLALAAALSASGAGESSYSGKGLSAGAESALTLRAEPIRYTEVIKTCYFDIIYPSQSERTARVLAEKADDIYESIASDFETEPWMHLPVVISPSTQVSNAYFSYAPNNKIVIYDTPPESVGDTTVKETIVNTFYHELVHALTANIHKEDKDNKLFFLGDYYTLPFLANSKLFFIEGATVSRESAGGGGRINSGLAMYMLIQAKLEGKFPSWRDVAGPLDVQPGGTASYYYGGAFSWWLQQEYGMNTYADFWKECSDNLGVTRIFRKTYGMSLDDAWELFYETIPVPETEENDGRIKIEDNGLFSPLAIRPGSNKGIVYGKNQGSVVYTEIDEYGSEKRRVLFNCNGYPLQLSFSRDGRYLAVSGYMTGTNDAYSVRIFDMETGRFTGAEIPFSRNAVITEDECGTAYIYCAESASDYVFATLWLLDDVLASEQELPEPVRRIELPLFDELFDSAAIPGGAACIRKKDGIWYVTVADINGTATDYRLPDTCVPLGLSVMSSEKDGTVTLLTGITSKSMNSGSETEPGSLSRLGVITITDGEATLSFQEKAFIGGVSRPVADEGIVYSIGKYAECYDVSYWQMDMVEMTQPVVLEKRFSAEETETEETYAEEFESEEYSSRPYLRRGTLFPIGGCLQSPISTAPISILPGLTWWLENPQGTLDIQLSAGFRPGFDSDGIYIEDTELHATVFGSVERITGSTLLWDAAGSVFLNELFQLDRVDLRASVLEQIPLSHTGEVFKLADTTVLMVGGSGKDTDFPRFVSGGTLSALYQYGVRKGMNSFSVSSISIGTQFFWEYQISDDVEKIYYNVKKKQYEYAQYLFVYPGIFASARLGRLLPLPYLPRLTVNMPLSVSASLCCNPYTFLDLNANVTLFSIEIQKGIPFVPFYCNRFTINAGWTFNNGAPEDSAFSSWSLLNSKEILQSGVLVSEQALTASVNFVVSPDVGLLYSRQFNLGINGKYYLNSDYTDKKYEVTILGIFKF